MCKVCHREKANLKHTLWDCSQQPKQAASRTIPPQLKEAAKSYNREKQLWAVEQVLRALKRHKTCEPATVSSRLGPSNGATKSAELQAQI